MAKDTISVTVDRSVSADSAAAGVSRSELVEKALRNEHLRRALHGYTTRTVPALNIDAYADLIYRANTCRSIHPGGSHKVLHKA